MRLRVRIIFLLVVAAILPLFAIFISLNLYANKQRESLVDMKLKSVYGGTVSLYEKKGGAILSQMQHLELQYFQILYFMIKSTLDFVVQMIEDVNISV